MSGVNERLEKAINDAKRLKAMALSGQVLAKREALDRLYMLDEILRLRALLKETK